MYVHVDVCTWMCKCARMWMCVHVCNVRAHVPVRVNAFTQESRSFGSLRLELQPAQRPQLRHPHDTDLVFRAPGRDLVPKCRGTVLWGPLLPPVGPGGRGPPVPGLGLDEAHGAHEELAVSAALPSQRSGGLPSRRRPRPGPPRLRPPAPLPEAREESSLTVRALPPEALTHSVTSRLLGGTENEGPPGPTAGPCGEAGDSPRDPGACVDFVDEA